MTELSKVEIIDLINNINIDGISNEQYTLYPLISEKDSVAVFGGEEGTGVTLAPGAYLAVWFRESDLGDFPRIRDYANNLDDDKFELVPNEDGKILIFMLGRLEA